MFATANSTAWEMARRIQQLEEEKKLKIEQAKLRQQHLQEHSSTEVRQPPTPAANKPKAVRRGSFGILSALVSKKQMGSVKSLDASTHTGADPTVITADETTQASSHKTEKLTKKAIATQSRNVQDTSKEGAAKPVTKGESKPPTAPPRGRSNTKKKNLKQKSTKPRRRRSVDAPAGCEQQRIVNASAEVEENPSRNVRLDHAGNFLETKKKASSTHRSNEKPLATNNRSNKANETTSDILVDGTPGESRRQRSTRRSIEKKDQVPQPTHTAPQDEEADALLYVEEAMSLSTKGSARPKKKAAPKTTETTVDSALVNPGLQDQTILVTTRDNFSDEVTCLTMDDFDGTPKRPNGRIKRTGRQKAFLDASERSSSSAMSDAGIAEILRKDVHSKKEPVLLAALDAIQEYASMGSKQRLKIRAFGGIPSILRVVENKKASKKVLLSALCALEKVTAKDTKNQETACDMNAILAICFCMQRNLAVVEVVLAASKTLQVITSCLRLASSKEEDEHQHVDTQGTMTALSCCLITHSKDKDILAHTVGAITNICLYRQEQVQLLAESGGVVAMTAAIQKKWKTKASKEQAKTDLQVILSLVDDPSSEKEEHESAEEVSSSESEGEE